MTPESTLLGNTIQNLLVGAAVGVAVFLLLKITRSFIVRRLRGFAERTKTHVDDLVLELLQKTRSFFLAVLGLYFGSQVLSLSPSGLRVLNVILVLGFLLQAAIWGNVVISFLLGRTVQQRVDTDAVGATTLSALGTVARVVLWSVLLLLALDNLGVNITGLVAGLGIGGIAVALALQNILGDLFASLSISLDKPFVIGDFIIVDEHLGTVEHVGLKTTRVRSLSGEQIIFSNGDLLNSRIRNYKRMYERRVVFGIDVTYQTPYEKLAAMSGVLKDIIAKQSDVRFDRAHFRSYEESSLRFEIVYFVKSPDYNQFMDIQQAINLEIYRSFGEKGIEFAYPTRTLMLQEGSDAPEGKPES